MKIETWELSGFGGGYEDTCQMMLWNAVKFLVDNRNVEFQSMQSDQIYGIAFNEGDNGKAFDEAMMKGIDDATGTMHHCATNHALYIKKHGYDKWFSEIKRYREPEGGKAFLFEYPHDFDLSRIKKEASYEG